MEILYIEHRKSNENLGGGFIFQIWNLPHLGLGNMFPVVLAPVPSFSDITLPFFSRNQITGYSRLKSCLKTMRENRISWSFSFYARIIFSFTHIYLHWPSKLRSFTYINHWPIVIVLLLLGIMLLLFFLGGTIQKGTRKRVGIVPEKPVGHPFKLIEAFDRSSRQQSECQLLPTGVIELHVLGESNHANVW